MDGFTPEWMQIASQVLAIVLVLWAVFKGIPDFLSKGVPRVLGQIEERHAIAEFTNHVYPDVILWVPPDFQ